MREVTDPVEDWLRGVLPSDLFEGIAAPTVKQTYGRSYFDKAEKIIYANWNRGTEVVVHEYGHHLQGHSYIMEAEKTFLRRRAGVTAESELVAVDPRNPKEVGFPGDFKAKGGHPYTGRVYGAHRTPDGDWDWGRGEVMSMGLERLYRDPGEFATDDPDFFFWVLSTLWRRP